MTLKCTIIIEYKARIGIFLIAESCVTAHFPVMNRHFHKKNGGVEAKYQNSPLIEIY